MELEMVKHKETWAAEKEESPLDPKRISQKKLALTRIFISRSFRSSYQTKIKPKTS